MCLIFFSLHSHPTYKLIVAANRDEFYNRKTDAARYWQDQPQILGGRDLEAGGTWMGITKTGRISFVTNYRDLSTIRVNAPSRGKLVSDYLDTTVSPQDYLRIVEKKSKDYNGFNLVVGTIDELWYLSNYGNGAQKISMDLHGLSNHLLETPWPKIVRGKEKLQPLLHKDEINQEDLFNILYDDQRAPDDKLPDTGIGIDRERALSSMFIKSPGYGSRCSTVVLINNSNHVQFSERVYNMDTFTYSTQDFQFDITA